MQGTEGYDVLVVASKVTDRSHRNRKYITWKFDGVTHRDDDLPAQLDLLGGRRWYRNGVLHRDGDKPAEIVENTRRWYQNGRLHRDYDRPAVIDRDGTLMWYQNGELHRDYDEPAVIRKDGSREWYQNGVVHRDGDRPAIILVEDSDVEYPLYISMYYATYGELVDEPYELDEEYMTEYPTLSMEWVQGGEPTNPGHYFLALDDGTILEFDKSYEGHLPDGTIYEPYPDGIEDRRFDNKRHADDGPDVILEDSTEMWYADGVLNRIGGPAVIFPDGTELWYKAGKLHREDGPAINDIHVKKWFLNGNEVTGERLNRMKIKFRGNRMKSARK